MGNIKKYFNNQFSKQMWLLNHEDGSKFYVSSLQRNQSPVPLLAIRLIIFAGCIGILLASIILTSEAIYFRYWPIYLTHWGLIFITVTSGFAFLVSVIAYKQGSIDTTFGLPWYVKVYWASYNFTLPIAIFITAFYWAFLDSEGEEYAIDPVLDVFIHAVNAVLMILLLLVSQHSSNILHFYYPILVGVIYMVFTIIYYHAGGTNPFGDPYIYPPLDWSDAGPTTVMVVASAVTLIVLHLIVVGLSLCRDWFSRRCIRGIRKTSLSIHD
ncbi:protein rolling stone-like [Aphomia sociella]